MKKKLIVAAAVAAVGSLLAGCSGTGGGASGDDENTISFAAFEGGYGKEMYQKVVDAYEKQNPDVTIDLKVSRTLADELTPQIAAGDYPDLVVFGQGSESGFTEGFVRDHGLADLADVLDITVPGEDVTVGDKLTDGIVGNLGTNPYGDDEIPLMPMYASPTGLVYDKGLFEKKGWDVPTTWDEMFALGDKAKADGISLFTYPTAGYLDSYFYSLLAAVGGEDFYQDVMTYKKDVWLTDEAQQALELTAKLLSYASPQTVGYANGQDFTKNQQSILDGKTLFMPNGAWIVNEMADAPRSDGFEWGMTPVPAPEAGDDRYLTTFIESAWIPKDAEHIDAAKDFLAFFYSDEAAAIFAKQNAIQPIRGLADTLTGEAASFSKVYEEPGVNALVGGFAATKPVQGVDITSTLFDTANSVISGEKTVKEWQEELNEVSNKLTDQLAG